MYIAILGRQPNIGLAELKSLYGTENVKLLSDSVATIDNDNFDFNRLGGSKKAGLIIKDDLANNPTTLDEFIQNHYGNKFKTSSGKITLGISSYGTRLTAQQIQKIGLKLKKNLRSQGVSLRLIPNNDLALNTATSHHNKLGLAPNKIELMLIKDKLSKITIAESVGAQNITALAARDQARPYTDPFVGMLPPKLAKIMINLAYGVLAKDATEPNQPITLLDPFCGSGVVLQESLIFGMNAYGTDLSEKMVQYSTKNIDWLKTKRQINGTVEIAVGDATKYNWKPPIDLVVAETYLGQPFNRLPSRDKLLAVQNTCNKIISSFLVNLHKQLPVGTPVCLALPAWRTENGQFINLPLLNNPGINRLGFSEISQDFNNLIYYRETQVVARKILLIRST